MPIEFTPTHSQPDFANHYAQLMVREGVNVVYLQRISRILSKDDVVEDTVWDVQGVVNEWERWFKNGKSA